MSYKKYIAALAGMSPICPILGRKKKMPRILFWHGVLDSPYYDRRVQANQIQFREFEKQIKYLKKHFCFISLDEFYDSFVNNVPFSGKEIIVTFDDGYKNNFTIAAPYLQSENIPFAVFVSTKLVDKEWFVPTYLFRSALLSPLLSKLDLPLLDITYEFRKETDRIKAMNDVISFAKTESDEKVHTLLHNIEEQLGHGNREEINSHFESERIMSWNDVRQLVSMGGIIGSHTEDHSILHEKQKDDDIKHQLKDSKNKIIRNFGKCDYFAFPNGDYASVCARSLEAAKDFYKMSFAVTGKCVSKQDDISYISRISVAFDLNVLKSQLYILS